MNCKKNIFSCIFLLYLFFYSCNSKDDFFFSFDCKQPIPFHIKISKQDIKYVDWEKQIWYFKPNTLNRLNSSEIPNLGTIREINNRICYGACILNAILNKDTLYRIKNYCYIAPVSVLTDTLPTIYVNHTSKWDKDSLIHLFHNNSLQLNTYKDSLINGKIPFKQQELNQTLNNTKLKQFLYKKNLLPQ